MSFVLTDVKIVLPGLDLMNWSVGFRILMKKTKGKRSVLRYKIVSFYNQI